MTNYRDTSGESSEATKGVPQEQSREGELQKQVANEQSSDGNKSFREQLASRQNDQCQDFLKQCNVQITEAGGGGKAPSKSSDNAPNQSTDKSTTALDRAPTKDRRTRWSYEEQHTDRPE